MRHKSTTKGVSPVIGIILMVAVTVILVALASNVVFDLGGDVGENPQITLEVDQTSDVATVRVLRNDNVDSLVANGESEAGDTLTNTDITSDTGQSTTLVDSSTKFNGTVTFVATVGGQEQVVRTVDIDVETSGGS